MKKKRNIIVSFFESVYGALTPEKTAAADKTQQGYHSFRAKFQADRTPLEALVDAVTGFFGSFNFVLFHLLFSIIWVAINLGWLSAFPIFDPYPFVFLTTLLSFEAILLATFVLMSQNRAEQISDLRQEVDFQINMQAEQEITRLIKMVNDIHHHLGLAKKIDRELEVMMKKLDPLALESAIVHEEARLETILKKDRQPQ